MRSELTTFFTRLSNESVCDLIIPSRYFVRAFGIEVLVFHVLLVAFGGAYYVLMAQGEPRQETTGVQSGDGGAYVDATACCTRRNKGSIRRFRLDFDFYVLDKGQMTMDDGRMA